MLREETLRSGALLIVDEIKTVCRLAVGGGCERYGIRPDLVVIGKAIANGFPLAAVGGRADVMDAVVRYLDLLHARHRDGLARGRSSATLGVMIEARVPTHITSWAPGCSTGLRYAGRTTRAAGGRRGGIPEMCFLEYRDEPQSGRVAVACAERGLLFKRARLQLRFARARRGYVDRSLEILDEALALGEALDAASLLSSADPSEIDHVLIDVHAHFLHDRTPRADWRERNASRLRAGERVGITIHVASILGSWGLTSPTYFPSPDDVRYGNDSLLRLQREHPDRIRGYVAVNPNYTDHALAEIRRCLDAGMIGIKLAASRRADDPLLDPICAPRGGARRAGAASHLAAPAPRLSRPGGVGRGASWAALAARHPSVRFILAHIGGGGDWLQTLPVVRGAAQHPGGPLRQRSGRRDAGGVPRTPSESSGCSGAAISPSRPGGPSSAISSTCSLRADLDQCGWRNAARIFPPGAFPSD